MVLASSDTSGASTLITPPLGGWLLAPPPLPPPPPKPTASSAILAASWSLVRSKPSAGSMVGFCSSARYWIRPATPSVKPESYALLTWYLDTFPAFSRNTAIGMNLR